MSETTSMRKWGIYHRLLVLAIAPALLATFILSTYFLYRQLDSLNSNLIERGMGAAERFAPSSEYGVLTGNHRLLTAQAQAFLNERDLVGIGVRDMQNHWLLQMGVSPDAATSDNSEGCARAHYVRLAGAMLFCAPINVTELPVDDVGNQPPGPARRLGTVYVRYSTVSLEHARNAAMVHAGGMALVGLLITVGFVLWVARQLARPVIQANEVVDAVGRGELDTRIETNEGGELGQLQVGINGMIEGLRSARDDMQRRIDEATARLRHTLKELEARNSELDEARARAEAANAAKGQFLATISHEIRTPISGMLGMIELLARGPLNNEQRLYIQNLKLEARVLRALIEDILDLSRIEAGKMGVREYPFEPETMVEEVVTILASGAHEKGLELIADIDPQLPASCVGDGQRIRQVLLNLVGNAIKFTEGGWVHLQARSAEQEGRTWLWFTVADTGIGIEPSVQQQIYESFTQLDASSTRRHGGSGLGTTIAKALVEMMGGRISLESSPGLGTRFEVGLPVQVREGVPKPAPLGRVLIADEDAQTRTALVNLFTRHGYHAAAVGDAQRLWTVLGDTEIDWVVLSEQGTVSHWLSQVARLRAAVPKTRLCHLIRFGGQTQADRFDQVFYKPLVSAQLRQLGGDDEAAVTPPPDAAGGQEPCLARVLVVEDSPINALALRRFVEAQGCEVLEARSGAEALAILEQGGVDLVFMDLRMPGMDGLETTRRWREREGDTDQRLPIIAVTANASEEDRANGLAVGMDDYLPKPVTPEQIAELINRYTGDK